MKKIMMLIFGIILINAGLFSGCMESEDTNEKSPDDVNGNGDQNGSDDNGGETPSGGKIVFRTVEDIQIIDPDGTNRVSIAEGYTPRWSPDGEKIGYLHWRDTGSGRVGELHVINADGINDITIYETGGFVDLCWSPDGEKIVVNSNLFNSDGSGFVELYEEAWNSHFSPDGNKIVFRTSEMDEHGDFESFLYVMDSDGSNPTKILDDDISTDYSYNQISWSPDGAKITFGMGEGLYTVNPDGSNKIMIDNGRLPAWSPDSNWIAYFSYDDSGLYKIKPDGTERTKVASGSKTLWFPSWSPDGKKIVFNSGENRIIYIVNADGSGLTELTSGTEPKWSPS
jgi:TolB protein